jgi:hypothetical protein
MKTRKYLLTKKYVAGGVAVAQSAADIQKLAVKANSSWRILGK